MNIDFVSECFGASPRKLEPSSLPYDCVCDARWYLAVHKVWFADLPEVIPLIISSDERDNVDLDLQFTSFQISRGRTCSEQIIYQSCSFFIPWFYHYHLRQPVHVFKHQRFTWTHYYHYRRMIDLHLAFSGSMIEWSNSLSDIAGPSVTLWHIFLDITTSWKLQN